MSGRYEPHEEYVSCDLASWDEMPSHWAIGRIKFMTLMNPSKSEVRHLKSDTPVTFLPMESIGDDGSLDVSKERPLHTVLSGYTYLAEGDVCVAKITPCFENAKGAIASGLRNGIGFATTEVIPMRCNRSTNSQFLYYFLTCAPFNLDAEASMYGAGGQKRVADSFVANYSAAFPPLEEQKQIAAFLDYETGKIDALIEKQQQLIALLGEKRQAVISHAVTKGLNPDAPMRDSGVEWLGEVPEHWTVGRMSCLIDTRKGVAFKSSDFSDVGVQVVKASDIKQLTIRTPSTYLPPEFLRAFPKAILDAGELVLSTVGSNPDVPNSAVGQIGQVPDFLAGSLLNQNTVVLSPHQKILANAYLFFLIQSDGYRDHLDLHAHGTANQSSLNVADMLRFRIPLPPPSEQQKIAERLSKSEADMETLIEKADDAVELLCERRTALISAAVTGKIDVRGRKPPAADPKKETEMEVA